MREFFTGTALLAAYFALFAPLILFLHARHILSGELARKALHILCAMSSLFFVYAFPHWYSAMGAALLFAAMEYPALHFAARFPRLMAALPERKTGEIKTSLFYAYLLFAAFIAVFWGLAGSSWRYLPVVISMVWGYGDAAAALVGKAYGRHVLLGGPKTLEGTLAMGISAFFAGLISLLLLSGKPFGPCFLAAAITAPIAAIAELLSKNGQDTVTVPLAIALPLFLILRAF